MKKLAFLLTVLIVLSTLLAACAPQATPAPAPAPAPTEAPAPTAAPAPTEVPPPTATAAPAPVTITYWAFGSEGSAMADGMLWTDWYGKLLKEYEAAHPGVTVDFALKGYDASGSTLVVDTAVAAGTPPGHLLRHPVPCQEIPGRQAAGRPDPCFNRGRPGCL